MENLINSLKLKNQEPQNFVKINMLQRFKEIVKDHQNDYNRSIVIFFNEFFCNFSRVQLSLTKKNMNFSEPHLCFLGKKPKFLRGQNH